MTPQQVKQRRERGAAALELAIAAPVLIILGALGLDLGVYLCSYAQADSAATAAARYIMDHEDANASTAEVQSYLAQTFPELGFGERSSVTSLHEDPLQSDTYTYHAFDKADEIDLSAQDAYQTFSVSVEINTAWPALATLVSNGDGTFSVGATAQGILDRTPAYSTWEVQA